MKQLLNMLNKFKLYIINGYLSIKYEKVINRKTIIVRIILFMIFFYIFGLLYSTFFNFLFENNILTKTIVLYLFMFFGFFSLFLNYYVNSILMLKRIKDIGYNGLIFVLLYCFIFILFNIYDIYYLSLNKGFKDGIITYMLGFSGKEKEILMENEKYLRYWAYIIHIFLFILPGNLNKKRNKLINN